MATTTKTLIVEIPTYDAAGNVTEWTGLNAWGFSTAAEREALSPTARAAAKSNGGRLVLLTETDDGAGTVTSERKILTDKTDRPVTVKADSALWCRLLRTLPNEPWAETFRSTVQAALGA